MYIIEAWKKKDVLTNNFFPSYDLNFFFWISKIIIIEEGL